MTSISTRAIRRFSSKPTNSNTCLINVNKQIFALSSGINGPIYYFLYRDKAVRSVLEPLYWIQDDSELVCVSAIDHLSKLYLFGCYTIGTRGKVFCFNFGAKFFEDTKTPVDVIVDSTTCLTSEKLDFNPICIRAFSVNSDVYAFIVGNNVQAVDGGTAARNSMCVWSCKEQKVYNLALNIDADAVTSLDVKTVGSDSIVVIGSQDGDVCVYKVDFDPVCINLVSHFKTMSFVTSLSLFVYNSGHKETSKVAGVVATSATHESLIYWNVFDVKSDHKSALCIPRMLDCQTCSFVHINDLVLSIYIGTYGCDVLVYEINLDDNSSFLSDKIVHSAHYIVEEPVYSLHLMSDSDLLLTCQSGVRVVDISK